MSSSHPQPVGLLIAMHRGDQEAARLVWEAHAGRLIALARAITGSHADAYDAVQESFLAVLRLGADRVAGIDDERGYLAGVVRSRSLNLLRSADRRARHERGVPLRLVGRSEDEEGLLETLALLPIEARELIALKHFAGLTLEQMAALMGSPRTTLASRYYDAVEQLRCKLAAHDRWEVARA